MPFYNFSKIGLLGIVPYHVIMNALAYQADPTSVEPLKVPTTKEVSNIFLEESGLVNNTHCDEKYNSI